MDQVWNRFGNKLSTYGDGYHYTNADGSKYYSNPDGSRYYDPGPSGKGRKWYCSPDGEKHYIEDESREDDSEEIVGMGHHGQGMSYDSYQGDYNRNWDDYDDDEEDEDRMWNTPIKQESSPAPPPRLQTARKTVVHANLPQPPKPRNPPFTLRKPSKPKEKEIHVHLHPRAPEPPMNVTRVVHHSSRGEKEIVYKSPAKVARDGRITKEKKVVHIHHHKR